MALKRCESWIRGGKTRDDLENVTEEQIAQIARFIGSEESKDFVVHLRHDYSLTSAMDVIKTWIKISGYSYKDELKHGAYSLVIQHDMGKKWSIYLSEIYKSVFEEFGQMGARITTTHNTVHVRYDGA
jgi:hypothetical protein